MLSQVKHFSQWPNFLTNHSRQWFGIFQQLLIKSQLKYSLLQDIILVLILFFVSYTAASNFLLSFDKGKYYQDRFAPAVMQACGRGYVNIAESLPALNQFLESKSNTFDCREIPQKITPLNLNAFQTGEQYLMKAVAAIWYWRGISWDNVYFLKIILYCASTLFLYCFLRLGMCPIIATAIAGLFALSSMQLINLQHLRDYSLVPFVLSVVWLTTLLVVKQHSNKQLFIISGLCGLVLGFGLGFRSDLFICVFFILVTLMVFVSPASSYSWLSKLAAGFAFLAMFIVAGFPILYAMQQGGNLAHVILLGLMDNFTNFLGLKSPAYMLGYYYNDSYMLSVTKGFAQHFLKDNGNIFLATREYEHAGSLLLLNYLYYFPADALIRIFASIQKVLYLPLSRNSVLADMRLSYWSLSMIQYSPYITVLLLACYRLRIGLWALFFMLFFGGYPVLQFSGRHFFYLEFITLACVGFLLQQFLQTLLRAAQKLMDLNLNLPQQWLAVSGKAMLRNCAWLAMCLLLMYGALLVARIYQSQQLTDYFNKILHAPYQVIETKQVQQPHSKVLLEFAASDKIADADTQKIERRYYKITLRPTCDAATLELDFKHQKQVALSYYPDYKMTVIVNGVTTVLFPAYNSSAIQLSGMELSTNQVACIAEVAEIESDPFPILPLAQLSEAWQQKVLYQHF